MPANQALQATKSVATFSGVCTPRRGWEFFVSLSHAFFAPELSRYTPPVRLNHLWYTMEPNAKNMESAPITEERSELVTDNGGKTRKDYSHRSELIVKITDVAGKLLLGIVGIWFGYLFHAQQQQLTRHVEEVRQELSMRQLDIQQNQFAASLIESLLNGTESEKLLSMTLLKSVDDSLALKVFQPLALHDPSVNVRLRAIEALGQSGASEALEILTQAQETGQTESERVNARRAEETLRSIRATKLSEELKIARSLLRANLRNEAAKHFYEALNYINRNELDAPKLAIAISHYEQGGYQEAAKAFNDLFPSP